ncbi:hypothetical protein QCA50_006576 [Cerrena zonata]|uniref:Uncharacterized protein n=1 Tax=Cerrena zonata TaxID=2478898 RepID=A0AAW0GAP2_9APHY
MSDKASLFSTTSTTSTDSTTALVNKDQKANASPNSKAQQTAASSSANLGSSAAFAKESQKQGWSASTATKSTLG